MESKDKEALRSIFEILVKTELAVWDVRKQLNQVWDVMAKLPEFEDEISQPYVPLKNPIRII